MQSGHCLECYTGPLYICWTTWTTMGSHVLVVATNSHDTFINGRICRELARQSPCRRCHIRLPRGLTVPNRHQRRNKGCRHVIYHPYPHYDRLWGGGKPWSCLSATLSFDGLATVMPTLRRHATKSRTFDHTSPHPQRQQRQTPYAQWSASQGLSNQLLWEAPKPRGAKWGHFFSDFFGTVSPTWSLCLDLKRLYYWLIDPNSSQNVWKVSQ